jgi:hypothetical protein
MVLEKQDIQLRPFEGNGQQGNKGSRAPADRHSVCLDRIAKTSIQVFALSRKLCYFSFACLSGISYISKAL